HETVAPRKGRQHEAHRFGIDGKVANHERSGDREGAALRIAERHPAHEQCDETPAPGNGAGLAGGLHGSDVAVSWRHEAPRKRRILSPERWRIIPVMKK